MIRIDCGGNFDREEVFIEKLERWMGLDWWRGGRCGACGSARA